MTDYPAGWTCELTVLRLERYLLATLPLGDALAVAEHIEACVTCAEVLMLVKQPGKSAGRRGR